MPFSEHRIKYLLREKTGKSLTELADEWGCWMEQISMCIRRARIYPNLRIKIAEAIGTRVDLVFGSRPLTTDLLTRRNGRKRKAA